MTAKRRAYNTLVTAGTNALCAVGMSLNYEDVSDEQKNSLTMTNEVGYTAHFEIDGVPCVAVSKPAGCGEERILVMYNTVSPSTALAHVKCAGALPEGTAVAKCTLEREHGPYIMKESRFSTWFFRATNAHKNVLSSKLVHPNGYVLNGPFVF
jgi:hypothetical protein